MKRLSAVKTVAGSLLFLFFISIGGTNLALGHFEVSSALVDNEISYRIVVTNDQSFSDFHVRTNDPVRGNFTVTDMPPGWTFDIVADAAGNHWMSFWGHTQWETTMFRVNYTGPLGIAPRADWRITYDGNSSPDDGVSDAGTGELAPLAADHPTLSQWVLIILALSVGGLFVWQLARRRKAALSV